MTSSLTKLLADIGITILVVSQVTGVAAQSNPAIAAYTPISGPCPPGVTLIRLATHGDMSHPSSSAHAKTIAASGKQCLSADEEAYITHRKKEVLPGAWTKYLAAVKATGVSLPDYIDHVFLSNPSSAPTLGIAQSGGGLRAAIVGAGIMNALDGRNATSVAAGTGGLLQAASYISGLSGGSWLLTSLSISDYPSLPELVLGSDSPKSTAGAGWLANYNVFQPTAANDTAGLTKYLGGLLEELGGKRQSGYPVTFTDMYARALSRHFLPGTTAQNLLSTNYTHGAGILFSDITKVPGFVNHQQPFPIVVANTDSQNGDKSQIDSALGGVVPINNPIYEFTPFEFGSWDPVLGAFTPTKYLGSKNSSVCTTRYDQASFIEGISSNLWEEFNTSSTALSMSPIAPIFTAFNATFNQPGIEQISGQVPNPFKGLGKGSFIDTDEDFLSLVDGGHTGENIPLQPLLVKARGVDTIFVIDVSADTADNFASGQSILATKNRTENYFSSAYSFPDLPASPADFVSEGLTTRPTFFGCDSTTPSTPLVIYVANGGPALGKPAVTNETSFFFNYPDQQIWAMFDQSFSFATAGMPVPAPEGNGKTLQVDPQWPACLACAIADRARGKAGINRSGVCNACFERYCWR